MNDFADLITYIMIEGNKKFYAAYQEAKDLNTELGYNFTVACNTEDIRCRVMQYKLGE